MHELSIALNIVEIASAEARKHGDARVGAVYLKLGPLSGVVKDALLFSWDVACEESPVADARLLIEETPVVVRCAACGAQCSAADEFDLRCPACGSYETDLQSGDELQLTAVEIEDG